MVSTPSGMPSSQDDVAPPDMPLECARQAKKLAAANWAGIGRGPKSPTQHPCDPTCARFQEPLELLFFATGARVTHTLRSQNQRPSGKSGHGLPRLLAPHRAGHTRCRPRSIRPAGRGATKLRSRQALVLAEKVPSGRSVLPTPNLSRPNRLEPAWSYPLQGTRTPGLRIPLGSRRSLAPCSAAPKSSGR